MNNSLRAPISAYCDPGFNEIRAVADSHASTVDFAEFMQNAGTLITEVPALLI